MSMIFTIENKMIAAYKDADTRVATAYPTREGGEILAAVVEKHEGHDVFFSSSMHFPHEHGVAAGDMVQFLLGLYGDEE